MTFQLALYAVATLLVVLGLAGTVLPVLPGALLVFAGLLVAAWADGFAYVGAIALTVIGTLGLLALGMDLAASALGAKRVGASPLALAGASLGALVGLFLGVPGLVFGPFVGAVLGELIARGDLLQAGRAGLGTWLGIVLAAIAKLVLALAMIGVFIAVYAFNR